MTTDMSGTGANFRERDWGHLRNGGTAGTARHSGEAGEAGPVAPPVLPPAPPPPPPQEGLLGDVPPGDGGIVELRTADLQDVSSLVAECMAAMIEFGANARRMSAEASLHYSADILAHARVVEEKMKKAAKDELVAAIVEAVVQAVVAGAGIGIEKKAAGSTKSAHDINKAINDKAADLSKLQKDSAAVRQGATQKIDEMEAAQRNMPQPGAFQAKADEHDQKVTEVARLRKEREEVTTERAKIEADAAASQAKAKDDAARLKAEQGRAGIDEDVARQNYDAIRQQRDAVAVRRDEAEANAARVESDWDGRIKDAEAGAQPRLDAIERRLQQLNAKRDEDGYLSPGDRDEMVALDVQRKDLQTGVQKLRNDRQADVDKAKAGAQAARDDLAAADDAVGGASATLLAATARSAGARTDAEDAASAAAGTGMTPEAARRRDELVAREQTLTAQIDRESADIEKLKPYVAQRDDYNRASGDIVKAKQALQAFDSQKTAQEKQIENEIAALKLEGDVLNNKAAGYNSVSRAVGTLQLGGAAGAYWHWDAKMEQAEADFLNAVKEFLNAAKQTTDGAAGHWDQQVQGSLTALDGINQRLAETTQYAVKA